MTSLVSTRRSVSIGLAMVGLMLFPNLVAGQIVEVLHSFSGCYFEDGTLGDCNLEWPDDGAHPASSLVLGADGYLYGTTSGGFGTLGTVYRVAPDGTVTRLRRIYNENPPGINGAFPAGTLAYGSDGAFYGVTSTGGVYGDGVLYQIAPNGTFSKLHDFDIDGIAQNNGGPAGGVVQAPDGRFYGTSQYDGPIAPYPGLVFRRETDGTVTTLHHFTGTDGQWPQADLVVASDGNIYGTTWAGGGAGAGACGYGGCGTIFRVLPTGTVEVVHAFDYTNGSGPRGGGLIQGADSNLYGVAAGGGDVQFSSGTAFRLSLDGTFTLLHSFVSSEGIDLRGSLFQAADGSFYGTASLGGTANRGTVFRMTPAGAVTVLHNFSGPEGSRPFGGLVQGSDGHLYGTTSVGGDFDLGVVFRLRLPRAAGDTLTVAEDSAASGVLPATDPAGLPLTYTIVDNGGRGTATLDNAATGEFTDTPQPNVSGSDSFTFRANNGTVDTNVATITVTITPVNDAPVAADGSTSTGAGTAVSGTLSATDIDNASLTYAVVANPANGTVVVTNPATGAFTYTPQAGFSGADTFTFRANDGTADSNVATITVTVGGNSAPVATNGALTTREERSVNGRLSATDANAQSLSFSIVSPPALGTVNLNAATGRLTYVPNANANGVDSFSFQASDGVAVSNVATVGITIAPVNDAPVAQDGSVTTQVNQPVSGTLVASDVDGDALTFGVARAPRRGSLIIGAAGGFTYTPAAGFAGTDSFRFRVADGAGSSAIATVTVTVSQ